MSNSNNNNNTPAVPSLDACIVVRSHFNELSWYLAVYLARGMYVSARARYLIISGVINPVINWLNLGDY